MSHALPVPMLPATASVAATSNRVRRALRDRGYALATSLGVADPDVLIAAAEAGFDVVQVDGEHRHLPRATLAALASAGRIHDIAVVPRVADHAASTIQHTLATGVAGILAPRVESAQDARRIVDAAYFPPLGSRGIGGSIPPSETRTRSWPEYAAVSNSEILVWIIVETAAGVEHLHEILAVPGIHAVLPGPFDLSAELGVAGEVGHSSVRALVSEIFRVAVEHGVHVLGSTTTEPGGAKGAFARGARILLAPGDLVHVRAGFAAARSAVDVELGHPTEPSARGTAARSVRV